MELNWTEEEQRFRAELRGFLESVDLGKPPKDRSGRSQWGRRWMAALYDNGYAGPSYPKEYGGMELSFREQLIYQEELARARVPAPPGNGVPMAGPTIIKYGTPEQRERFIRPMLRADEIWAQGFSEPGAGSDLPSLRTTARRDGDHYVVNGQKVWNTQADLCDWAFVLVRTGEPGTRQDGISYLLIDLSSPGVDIRRLRDITGGTAFCEMFFDDVRVPVANRVGEENEGWRIARTTLGHERSSGALKQAAFYRRKVDEILDLARSIGASKDPVVRQRLADADMRVRVMQISAMRMIQSIIENGEPGPISSVSRLSNSLFEQQLHELALDLLGREGLYDSREALEGGRWVYGYLRTRGSTIGAGTAEIQRNTIAEQVLQLPYDPAMPAR
ncbi:acyl-CoA dehydrogenase family protein [Microbacterium sp. No. 7]|uniref:acyl-CoA dehydrogenase family protein n=1 Tax=Microbacterium sp. No. 7 TaxID=1714373 RepID=UPI0006D01B5E|nr:acyl-CoA dehydrogenase family protein [Microbacterium sp. No. 7]ALJ18864.1 isovaleryl-CoA dehydrogenase [Microbacterium sp. No. 7]